MLLRLPVLLAALLLLLGCASDPVPLVPGRNLPLMEPSALGRSVSLSQLVVGEFEGKNYRMRYEVEIAPSRLAIVGLSPLGLTLFTLTQQEGRLDVRTNTGNPIAIDPRYTLFDLYLTYWPVDALRTGFADYGLLVEESRDGLERRVSRTNGVMIAVVTYSKQMREDAKIRIEHFDIPYRLRVTSLERRAAR